MKRFLSLFLLVCGLVMAGGAKAIPVTWTIPATTLSSTNNSISGTFVYDADTNTTSSINLTSVVNGVSSNLTFAGSNQGGYLRFQATSQAIANTTPGAYVGSANLSNAGGPANVGLIGNGSCNPVNMGICSNVSSINGGGLSFPSIFDHQGRLLRRPVLPRPPSLPIG